MTARVGRIDGCPAMSRRAAADVNGSANRSRKSGGPVQIGRPGAVDRPSSTTSRRCNRLRMCSRVNAADPLDGRLRDRLPVGDDGCAPGRSVKTARHPRRHTGRRVPRHQAWWPAARSPDRATVLVPKCHLEVAEARRRSRSTPAVGRSRRDSTFGDEQQRFKRRLSPSGSSTGVVPKVERKLGVRNSVRHGRHGVSLPHLVLDHRKLSGTRRRRVVRVTVSPAAARSAAVRRAIDRRASPAQRRFRAAS